MRRDKYKLTKKEENELFKKYSMLFKRKDDKQISLMCFGFEILRGWSSLLERMLEFTKNYAEKNKLDIEVEQIKQKFSSLRFYVQILTPNIKSHQKFYSTLLKMEKESFSICEYCGSNGKIREDRMWIETLCDKCWSDRNKNE